MRLSTILLQAPWRRKKEDVEGPKGKRESRIIGVTASGEYTLQTVDESAADTAPKLDYKTWRLSRILRSDNATDQSQPTRSMSLRQNRRSIFRPSPSPEQTTENNPQDKDESLLKKLRRKSQNFTLPRPSTSNGVSKRRSFFGGTADDDEDNVPSVPFLPSTHQQHRPLSRHVPITIDHLQEDHSFEPEPGPGMAITSNDVHNTSHIFSEQPRSRPISSHSSFSQLRIRSPRTVLTSHPTVEESESDHSDDDILTALPEIEFKEMTPLELKSPALYNSGPYAPADRHVIQRATPKVVDIVAPRPMSMFSTQPKPREKPKKERVKSMVQTTASPIGPLEDGPKGDWTRTRHSWIGAGAEGGKSEQLEWDKLKQFIEAFGTGQDGAVVSMVRQLDDSEESSSSDDAYHGNKYSNAQALAALEFGLN